MSIPKEQRALVLEEEGKYAVKTIPAPDPARLPPGAVIVRILTGMISPGSRSIYNSHGYGPPISKPPFVTGQAAIARIVAVGPDGTTLKPNDLVYVDTFVRARDTPDGRGMLFWGYFIGEDAGAGLANGPWRDGSNAEFAQAPMENCYLLDEPRLCGELGYSTDDLGILARLVVAYSGFTEMGLRAGETVAIAPATGSFGGAGIPVALAMGAHVVAAGRNTAALERIVQAYGATGRLTTAQISGTDAEADAQAICAATRTGAIDAYLDFVPFSAQNPTFLKSGLLALRFKGRACIMGGCLTDVAVPYTPIYRKNLKLFGRFMYERETPAELIRLVESGMLLLGDKGGFKNVGAFALEDYDKAFEAAEKETGGIQTAAYFRP